MTLAVVGHHRVTSSGRYGISSRAGVRKKLHKHRVRFFRRTLGWHDKLHFIPAASKVSGDLFLSLVTNGDHDFR
jgi:hypothetical protein